LRAGCCIISHFLLCRLRFIVFLGSNFEIMHDIISKIYPLIEDGAKITIDSRAIEPNSIFLGLKGKHSDGNLFASEAIEKGAILAVVDNTSLPESERIIKTDDSLSFLHALAKHHRGHLNIPIIGITGSNGKTTTKELVSVVLARKYKTLSTPGNYNNHIGLPLTLLSITQEHEIAVIEMGANHLGEIDLLCNIAMPTCGLITNIGKAHIEGFGSEDNVVVAKTELYRYLFKNSGLIFVNNDNTILSRNILGDNWITYGKSKSAHYQGEILQKQPFVKIAYHVNTDRHGMQNTGYFSIDTNLVGEYNFENIMSAVAVGHYFGVSPESIKKAVEDYHPTNNRSQFKDSGRNQIIMDAYNANPTSMMAALQNFAGISSPRKVVILGDMLELGNISEAEHKQVLEAALKLKPDKLLLVGQEFGKVDIVNSQTFKFSHCSEAIDWLQKNPLLGYTVLIKGSRGIKLEKLESLL